nr:hypothetical protein TetV2_00284 [Oceanusvirus sp.]
MGLFQGILEAASETGLGVVSMSVIRIPVFNGDDTQIMPVTAYKILLEDFFGTTQHDCTVRTLPLSKDREITVDIKLRTFSCDDTVDIWLCGYIRGIDITSSGVIYGGWTAPRGFDCKHSTDITVFHGTPRYIGHAVIELGPCMDDVSAKTPEFVFNQFRDLVTEMDPDRELLSFANSCQ